MLGRVCAEAQEKLRAGCSCPSGVGLSCPSGVCSAPPESVCPALLPMETHAGWRRRRSRCTGLFMVVVLEPLVLPAGTAPAPCAVPFCRGVHCNHGKGGPAAAVLK